MTSCIKRLVNEYAQLYNSCLDTSCISQFPNPTSLNCFCRNNSCKNVNYIKSLINQLKACCSMCSLPTVEMFNETSFEHFIPVDTPEYITNIFDVTISGNVGDVLLIDGSVAAAVIGTTSFVNIFYTLLIDNVDRFDAGFQINQGLNSGNGFNIETSKLQYGLTLLNTSVNIKLALNIGASNSLGFTYTLNQNDAQVGNGVGAYLRVAKFSGNCSSVNLLFPAQQDHIFGEFSDTYEIIPATSITVPSNSTLLLDGNIFANMSDIGVATFDLEIDGNSVGIVGFQSGNANFNQYETSMLTWAFKNNTNSSITRVCKLTAKISQYQLGTTCTVIYSSLRVFITSIRSNITNLVNTTSSWSMLQPSGNYTDLFQTNIGTINTPSMSLIDFIASTETDYVSSPPPIVDTSSFNSYNLTVGTTSLYAGFQPNTSDADSPGKYETSTILVGINLPANNTTTNIVARASLIFSNNNTNQVVSKFGGSQFPSSSGYLRVVTFY